MQKRINGISFDRNKILWLDGRNCFENEAAIGTQTKEVKDD